MAALVASVCVFTAATPPRDSLSDLLLPSLRPPKPHQTWPQTQPCFNYFTPGPSITSNNVLHFGVH
eukprot:4250969-Amphidinium_carterae.1